MRPQAFVFNGFSMVHPKSGAPLTKKCTVHQREGCTFEAEHPDGSVSEKQKYRKPNYQRLRQFRTVKFSWTFGTSCQNTLVKAANDLKRIVLCVTEKTSRFFRDG